MSTEKIGKFSAAPIYVQNVEQLKLPFQLTQDISLESLKGQIQPSNFIVWDRFVPKDSLERFIKMDTALVHKFYSWHGSGEPEQASKDLLHKVFVCLRLIRPTRTSFSVVQFFFREDKKLDVFSFIEPKDPVSLVLPESEVLNRLSSVDILKLRNLLPRFFAIDNNPTSGHVRRAIRYFEGGYDDIQDAVLQFTVWMMGIESLFASSMNYEVARVKDQIREAVGSKTDIYSEFADRDLYHAKPVMVGDILDDLFKLRDLFAHGRWAPADWLQKEMRSAITRGGINYAEVLREAASFILRKAILNTLG